MSEEHSKTTGWCPVTSVCDRDCEQGPSRTQVERCSRMIEIKKQPIDPKAPLPETTVGARKSPHRVVQISAMNNGCFALCEDGKVYVCIYDGVLDDWIWYQTRNTPGVQQ